jgi:hypothetical protein
MKDKLLTSSGIIKEEGCRTDVASFIKRENRNASFERSLSL